MNQLFLAFLIVYFTSGLSHIIAIPILAVWLSIMIRKKQVIVLILMIAMIIRPYLFIKSEDWSDTIQGRVIKIYEDSFLIQSSTEKVLIADDQEIIVDSLIEVTGTRFSVDDSPHFFEAASVSDNVMSAERIEILHEGSTFRSWIHKKSLLIENAQEQELVQKILLRFSSDEMFLQSAAAVQITMILRWIRQFLKRLFYDHTLDWIEVSLLILFGLMWDSWFVCFRIMYFKIMKKRKIPFYDTLGVFCVTCYLFDPQLVHQASFWYIIFLRLSVKTFSNMRIGFLFTMVLVSLCFYAGADVIEILLFSVMQMIASVSLLLCLLRLFVPISLTFWIQVLSIVSEKMPVMEIRGSLSLISVFVLLILFSQMNERRQYIGILVFVAMFLVCGLNPFARVIFFNVGQGDCILIHEPFSFRTVLIDTGSPSSYYQLRQSLYAQSIYEIDLLVLSHGDLDHSGNLGSICSDFRVKEIWDNTMNQKTSDLFSLQQINVFDQYEDENEKSLVLTSRLNGLDYLFLGDVGTAKEEIFSSYINEGADVCKIGHHGSKTSTSWTLLDHAGCDIAVISAGVNNRYGHPHEEVMDRLERNGSIVFNTQIHGDIQIRMTRFFNLVTTSNHEFGIIFKK